MEPSLTPDSGTQHRAPPPYRPMSGMAIFAFVLSLIGILAGLFFWWVPLIPLALGIIVLTTVSSDTHRGRGFAMFAIGIAVITGIFFYTSQAAVRGVAVEVSGSILTALSSEATDAEKDAVLKGWILPETLEKKPELLGEIRARFARVVAEYGKYQHPPEVGSLFSGWVMMIVPPEGTKGTEIGRLEGEKAPFPEPGQCIWVRARFEKATLDVAFEWFDGKFSAGPDLPSDLEPGDELPIISNVRFFKADAP